MVLLGRVFNVNATLYLPLVAWLSTHAAARRQSTQGVARWLQPGRGALFVLRGARIALRSG